MRFSKLRLIKPGQLEQTTDLPWQFSVSQPFQIETSLQSMPYSYHNGLRYINETKNYTLILLPETHPLFNIATILNAMENLDTHLKHSRLQISAKIRMSAAVEQSIINKLPKI